MNGIIRGIGHMKNWIKDLDLGGIAWIYLTMVTLIITVFTAFVWSVL